MQEMGIAAIYPGPNLSRRHLDHQIYPYLLRGVTASEPNHIWGIDITYIRFTPGHTLGHMCLYLERTRTLLAGDALTATDGRLQGPNPAATPDIAQAGQSVQKLAALDVATIVCYHGGVVQDDAHGQLQRVAAEMAASLASP
jgi:glyoxylase-like metal-dependent hydrolase (beta-lactamase superfamily II)